MLKSHALRVFPNGEFGVGLYRRFKPETQAVSAAKPANAEFNWMPSEVHSINYWASLFGSLSRYLDQTAPGFAAALHAEICTSVADTVGGEERDRALEDGGYSPLGLSDASNSHNRAKRGTAGLTSYGKKMIRNGCWLLQSSVCRGGVGMVTATIPTCGMDLQREIVASWSEILRVFTQWLSRRLKAAGSKFPAVLGVTEIQEERQREEGGLPLHLHLVFSARKGRAHIVTPSDIASAWERAVCGIVPSAKNLQWNAATRVETVRKSVAGYLSKYMSKGSPEAMLRAESEGFQMPSAWWFMVGKLKRTIKKLTVYRTDSVATEVWYQCVRKWGEFDYCVPVNVQIGGEEVTVGFAGKVSGAVLKWMQAPE